MTYVLYKIKKLSQVNQRLETQMPQCATPKLIVEQMGKSIAAFIAHCGTIATCRERAMKYAKNDNVLRDGAIDNTSLHFPAISRN